MRNRRIFLKSVIPLAAAITLPRSAVASEKPDLCRFYADCLRDAMKEQHGGEWDVTINPDAGSIFGRRLN